MAFIGAYTLGMWPTAKLVGHLIGHDPTVEGSGNPGATNMYRIGGRLAGLVVATVDMAKGAIPTLAALVIWGRPEALGAWLGAVLGHVWPVIPSLRGGKGVAAGAGGALMLDPLVGLVCGVLFAGTVGLSRIAALGSLSVAVGYPIMVAVRGWHWHEVLVAVIVTSLMTLRHRGNIVRLWRGTEPKL